MKVHSFRKPVPASLAFEYSPPPALATVQTPKREWFLASSLLFHPAPPLVEDGRDQFLHTRCWPSDSSVLLQAYALSPGMDGDGRPFFGPLLELSSLSLSLLPTKLTHRRPCHLLPLFLSLTPSPPIRSFFLSQQHRKLL